MMGINRSLDVLGKIGIRHRCVTRFCSYELAKAIHSLIFRPGCLIDESRALAEFHFSCWLASPTLFLAEVFAG